jgi:predicted Zn-dependent protease
MTTKKTLRRRSGARCASVRWQGPHALRALAERVLRFSRADGTEVRITGVTDALTRFARNAIHQNVAEESLTVSIRAVVDGRTARVTTNRADDESLRSAAASAAELAILRPKDRSLPPLLDKQRYAKVRRFVPATAASTAMDRAKVVAQAVRMAEKRGQKAAGVYSTGRYETVLANSRGLFAHYEQTRAEFSITIMEEDSSGWAKASATDARQLDISSLAAQASEKARLSRNPRVVDPGHYTAILEPPAVLDLLGFLFYDFSGTAVEDKRSCLLGRMGRQVFGRNFSVTDDVHHPLQLGEPFDGEGQPRGKVALVDRGVPRNLAYARATAKRMCAKPTGHGFDLPNDYGEAPVNLVVEGGTSSVEEMVGTTERGILVTRLWYIREVDPYEKIVTGMTRDGTFLVEKGRVTGGIRNFRFNQSLIEMLGRIQLLGPSVRASGEETFEMIVPAMTVGNFHFSEVTKF